MDIRIFQTKQWKHNDHQSNPYFLLIVRIRFHCFTYFSLCRAEQPDYGDLLRIPEPRRIDHVVDEDSSYAVFVSFVEIYNNYVYDLLEDSPTDNIKAK